MFCVGFIFYIEKLTLQVFKVIELMKSGIKV
nr:MAG TPA: hypothetical protein [Bacteriophage sp.]